VRVLFVNRMLGMARGGGETFDLEIGARLERLGCRVGYLAGRPLVRRAPVALGDRRVEWLRTPDLTWVPWDRLRGGWRLRMLDFQLFERRAAARARRREGEVDVIQVCELPWFVHWFKRKGGRTPVVLRLTAPDFYDPVDGVGAADAVIAAGATLERVRHSRRPDCVAIQNGVDPEFFSPGPSGFRRRHRIPPEALVILMVARFHYVKRHDLVLDAFARLCSAEVPDVWLVLVGSGPLERRVRRQVAEYGLGGRVVFLGETPYSDLPEVYRAADVAVIASEYESFCFAALEAMACGLPVVTTDTEWVPRLIGNGRGGLVVPRGDAAALAAALETLGCQPELRVRMGRWNRREVKSRYTWDGSARELLNLYRELTAAQGKDTG